MIRIKNPWAKLGEKVPTRFLSNDYVTLHNYCGNIFNADV